MAGPRPQARHLRLWRGGHIAAQMARWQGAGCLRLHPHRRRRGSTFGIVARRMLGRRFRGSGRPPELDAAIIYAPAGASCPACLACTAQGRTGGLRRHPHVGHSKLSLQHSLGRATDRVGRQSHATGRHRFSQECSEGRRSNTCHRFSHWIRRTKRSRACVTASLSAQPS